MKELMLMAVSQPIGTFYMGKMSASDIIKIKAVKRLQEGMGVQRLLKNDRVKSIALFCQDPDATFPTPVILSIRSEDVEIIKSDSEILKIRYNEENKIAEILDGQHRVEGIERSDSWDFELPVIIMFDLTEAQKAYVFSTINGTQERVNPSLIYELFELSPDRSPYKTCHEIARALNSDPQSPFFRRLKMLEKREYSTETISQNTFVKNLCKLITNTPKEDAIKLKRGEYVEPNKNLAFSKYFYAGADKDAIILKILINYFSAAREIFSTEWDSPSDCILTKTVGFSALMDALNTIVPMGESAGTLSQVYFEGIFLEFRNLLISNNLQLTSDYFSSSGADKSELAKLLIEAARDVADTNIVS